MASDVILVNALERALTGNEDAAWTVHHELARLFGWSGTMFSRGDAQTTFEKSLEARDQEVRALTDEEWARIQDTWEWRKLGDGLTELGWDMVDAAVREVIDAAAGSETGGP